MQKGEKMTEAELSRCLEVCNSARVESGLAGGACKPLHNLPAKPESAGSKLMHLSGIPGPRRYMAATG